jgi:hypothetical protein
MAVLISQLKSVVAKQQEQIAALVSQIQNVSNRVKLNEDASLAATLLLSPEP